MRVAVLGAGALGGLFAGRLVAAGVEVTLVAHRPEQAQLLAQQGLTLTGPEPGATITVRPRVAAVPLPAATAADLVLVTVKASDTDQALQDAAGLVGTDTWVLTLQNGLGNAEAIAARVGPERTLVGVTAQGARLVEPGRVHHAGGGPTRVGPYWGTGEGRQKGKHREGAARAAALLRRAGFAVEELDARAMQSAVWSKLLVNAGINALTALLGVANGRLAELPGARELLGAAVAEGAAVAATLGIPLLHPDPVAYALEVARSTAANRSSMLADVEARRRTEIRQINGAIAELAAAVGLPAPVNRTLTLLVEALEQDWTAPG